MASRTPRERARDAWLRVCGYTHSGDFRSGARAQWPEFPYWMFERRQPGGTRRFGENFTMTRGVRVLLVSPGAEVSVGDWTLLNWRVLIQAAERITIGSRCAIGYDTQIMDTDFHYLDNDVVSAPVTIGNDVWIASKCSVLKGVTIGDGAVIGCNSVVTSDVPPRTLAVGTPARVIRENVSWVW